MSQTGKKEDIKVFADTCAFSRSVYLHFKTLFETSTDEDRARMARAAETLFGDLHKILVEYIILQICKITDPAQDFKKNDNHTVAFLLQHYGVMGDPQIGQRLTELDQKTQAFRQKLLPARNKLISHADRAAILAGNTLGGAPQADWDQFWLDLEELVNIIHERVTGEQFKVTEIGMLTDADGLLKALHHAEHFDQLLSDKTPNVAKRAAEVAFSYPTQVQGPQS
ncbi:MAG TPA: hypothetical protein VNW15_09795 [Rhizomicrobium sp.]|jgi:hypothetical protein|nr:hypothetical protein [Rhizomicrobium sp.]